MAKAPAAPPRWTEYMPLDEIQPALRNPKEHDAELIASSVARFGTIEAPALDERTGRLVSGHGRWADAQARKERGEDPPDGIVVDASGAWLMAVQRGWSSTSDQEAHAAGVALNEGTIRGGWKRDELAELLEEIRDDPAGLDGVYDESGLDELLADVAGFPVVPGSPHIPAAVAVDVDLLRAHPSNYQAHPDDQQAHLVQSIEQFSFYKNIVVSRDNVILAGHGSWAAAKAAGLPTIPVVRLDLAADSPSALKIVALDNEIGRFADRDDRALTELLRQVAEGDPFGLAGTGYDEMILANLAMITRPASEIADFNAAAEWAGLPDFEPAGQMPRLIINFENEAARDRFIETAFEQGHVSKRSSTMSWSAHWPKRVEPREGRAVAWVDGDEADPS